MSDEVRRVALFAHRWSAEAPTGMGRHFHGVAAGLAEVLHGDADPGSAGPRDAVPGTDGAGRRWAVTATSAMEPDAGAALPAGIGWVPLRGPRKARLAGWRFAGIPKLDGPLGHPALVHSLLPFVPVARTAPLVVTVPDTIPVDHPDWYRGFERWGFAGGFAQLAAAEAVVVSSAHVARQLGHLRTVAADRIAVVPLGVDAAFGEVADPAAIDEVTRRHGVEPGRYLLAVGQVSTRKNVGVLLDALAELAPTGGVELLLVGPAGDVDVPDSERVRVAGFVPDADLRALLQGAQALVHPSTAEGFGLTPLEAMASGTPAIAARASSLPEVVGDAGLLVPPRDAVEWAAAIQRLRDDEGLRPHLVAAGRARAAIYTWRRAAEGHLAVWAAVLEGRPVASVSPSPG